MQSKIAAWILALLFTSTAAFALEPSTHSALPTAQVPADRAEQNPHEESDCEGERAQGIPCTVLEMSPLLVDAPHPNQTR